MAKGFWTTVVNSSEFTLVHSYVPHDAKRGSTMRATLRGTGGVQTKQVRVTEDAPEKEITFSGGGQLVVEVTPDGDTFTDVEVSTAAPLANETHIDWLGVEG